MAGKIQREGAQRMGKERVRSRSMGPEARYKEKGKKG